MDALIFGLQIASFAVLVFLAVIMTMASFLKQLMPNHRSEQGWDFLATLLLIGIGWGLAAMAFAFYWGVPVG